MATIAPKRPELEVQPGYRGLLGFSEAIGESLEPHEKRIARAHFGDEREVYAILPRGNLKTRARRPARDPAPGAAPRGGRRPSSAPAGDPMGRRKRSVSSRIFRGTPVATGAFLTWELPRDTPLSSRM